MSTKTIVRCSQCQRAYTSLDEFEQVRSIGMALKGLCRCGQWLSAGALWQMAEVQQLASVYQRSGKREHSIERLRAPVSAQQLVLFEMSEQMAL